MGKDPQFGTPEKRKLQQIVFPNDAEAGRPRRRSRRGQLRRHRQGREASKPRTSTSARRRRTRMFDKAIADAAFALPPGGVSGVVKGQFGPVIVRVKDHAGERQALDEVADAVKKQIAARARRRQDAGPARQDRGRARLRQVASRSREGRRPDRASDRRGRRRGQRPERRAGRRAGQGRTAARRLRVRRRRRRAGAEHQGPRLRLVRSDQGRTRARPHASTR